MKFTEKPCVQTSYLLKFGTLTTEYGNSWHYSADFTQEIYVNTERVVYNADFEIIAFALEVLPKNDAAQLIPLAERYLLEVLP